MASPNANMLDTPAIRPPFPAWSPTVSYNNGDVVSYAGQNWVAIFYGNNGGGVMGHYPPDDYPISLRPTAGNGFGIYVPIGNGNIPQNIEGGVWINLTLTTPPAPFWSQTASYQPGTVVTYPPWSPGTYWIASSVSVGETPESNSQYWQRLQGGVSGASSSATPSSAPYVPPTPTDFMAGTASQNSVIVNWTNPSGSFVSYYNLYIEVPSYTLVGTVYPPALSYTYTGLDAESTYYVKIESVFDNGVDIAVSPPAYTTITTTAITQSAPIQNLRVISSSPNSIGVEWDTVSPPCDSIYYVVSLFPASPVLPGTQLPGSYTTVDLTGLSPNTSYRISVYTVTAGLTDGAISNVVFITNPLPDPPENPQDFIVDNVTSNSIQCTYTLATTQDITLIEFYKSLDGTTFELVGSISNPADSDSFSFTGLDPSTDYYFRCRVQDVYGSFSGYTQASPSPQSTLP